MEHRVCGPKLERGRDDWSVPFVPMLCVAGRAAEGNSTITSALVELVLRRRDGSFLPGSYLLNTFCHEVCSDRSCIDIVSHFRLRCFDYAISPLVLNHLMTPLPSPSAPLARTAPGCFSMILTRKSLLMIPRTDIYYTYN